MMNVITLPLKYLSRLGLAGLVFILTACGASTTASPVTAPPSERPVITASTAFSETTSVPVEEIAVPSATLVAQLQTTVAASLPPTAPADASGVTMGGIEGVQVLPLTVVGNRPPLWAVFSYRMRSFSDPIQKHFVAIYSHRAEQWQQLSRLELENADYMDESSVTQVQVEPSQIWLAVEAGVGAHGGCYDLLSFDGQTLHDQVSQCGASPGLGRLEDLNHDGQPEVTIDQSDPYIFCYACNVRRVQFQVLQWDGTRLVEVTLAPVPASSPGQAHELINQAVALAQANLWKDAQATISQILPRDGQDAQAVWDMALIRLHADAKADQAHDSGYPLLDNIFYGDYAAALEVMRPYPPDQIFNPQTPLVKGTVAEGFETNLSQAISDTTTSALTGQPHLAAAYFLRSWATYLASAGNPNVLADLKRAAQLDPHEPLFARSVEYVQR